MKILIVAINYAPELTGIGKYVGEMSDGLAAQEFAVRVVTAPPYYPSWRIASEYRPVRYTREQRGAVTVFRCPLYVPAQPTAVRRIVHLLSFAISSLPLILWQAIVWRPRIVFVVEPPFLCAPIALVAAWLARARTWLHVQDFELDAAFQLGFLRSARLRAAIAATERWLLRRFDRVSTISPGMARTLASKGVAEQRRFLFPNWVDTEAIRPESRVNALRAEIGIPADRTVVLYSGNLGQKQGLEVLVEAARLLADDPSLLFLICGDGPLRPAIEAAAAELGNLRLAPLQPLARLSELLGIADLHALPQRADVEDLVMPSKLTAMMASGRPVVAGARPGSEVAGLVACAGRVVAPGDAAAFAAAVRELAADPVLRDRCGCAARAIALRTWDKRSILAHAFSPASVAALADV